MYNIISSIYIYIVLILAFIDCPLTSCLSVTKHFAPGGRTTPIPRGKNACHGGGTSAESGKYGIRMGFSGIEWNLMWF